MGIINFRREASAWALGCWTEAAGLAEQQEGGVEVDQVGAEAYWLCGGGVGGMA